MKLLIKDISTDNDALWNHRYIWDRKKIINNERQMYTDPDADPAEHAITNQGNALTAMQASPAMLARYGQPYQSALLTTHKHLAFMYGQIDIVAKVSPARGCWPALWLLREYGQWPKKKPVLPEIDIMEYLGKHYIHGTAHFYTDQNDAGSRIQQQGGVEIDVKKYNKFSFKWNEHVCVWMLNGKPFHQIETPEDFKAHFHLLLNVAVGGWAGDPVAEDFPNQMLIDSITITTDDLLYDLPPLGVEVVDMSSLPDERPDPMDDTQVVDPVDVPTPPNQPTPDDSVAANPQHVQLTAHLINAGWTVHHNRNMWREVMRNYMTGEPLPGGLHHPTFELTDANIDIAWGGILMVINNAIKSGQPSMGGTPVTEPDELERLRAKLQEATEVADGYRRIFEQMRALVI